MPETILGNLGSRALFPDSHLGRDSGGHPDEIPCLTYETFRRFHEEHYHPSNALIFLYGDIPSAEQLAFLAPVLDGFDRRPARKRLPAVRVLERPAEIEETYPVGPTDELRNRTFLSLSWHLGDALNAPAMMDWAVLSEVLLGNESAPLKKALVDARLGEDLLGGGAEPHSHEALFHLGLKGSEPERSGAFEARVLQTLEALAARPLPPERVSAAYQQLSYHHREVSSQFPLKVLWEVLGAWPYGADPLLYLQVDELLKESERRNAADPMRLPAMIRTGLLENPRRLRAVLRPDRDAQRRQDERFAERMAKVRASLGPRDLERVARAAAALEEAQATPNSPEALAKLPQLKVSDLPARPRRIPTELRLTSGVPVLHNDVFANGVNYLDFDIDLAGLPPADIELLPRYCDAFRKMGAAGEGYEAVALRRAACTGSLSCYWYVARPVRADARSRFSLRIGLKTLDGQAPSAFRLLEDLLFDLDPRDPERLRDMLSQAKASYRTNFVNDGLSAARRHAMRRLTAEAALDYAMHCPARLADVERALARFDGQAECMMSGVERIRSRLADPARWTLSFTGSDGVAADLERALGRWVRRAAAAARPSPPSPVPFTPSSGPTREGLASPLKVAHCVRAMPGPFLMDEGVSLLNLGLYLLRFDYFLPEIRLKGNAYGCGIGLDDGIGVLHMHSYDDPRIRETLDVFDCVARVVRNAAWSQTDVDRAVIGSAKTVERPIRPGDATSLALTRYLRGDSDELREQRYAATLRATPDTVRAATLRHLEAAEDRATLCVVSSREKLEQANLALGERALDIQDLLPD
jgi:hypothetical protein